MDPMRDIFTEIFEYQPLDPMVSARKGGRPTLRKRFYSQAHVGEGGPGGFPVLLDGKQVFTPARRPLATPTRALAEAIAREWDAQAALIDPGRMPLTRLANAVIDAVAEQAPVVAEEIAQYLGSDLTCYRAGSPEGLVEKQALSWDPLLAWARDALGARFVLAQGIMHVAQPRAAIDAARAAIPADIWRLGAVSAITTLTGSGLLALAMARDAIDKDAAWAAAHADEDWQMSQWGRDEQALARRNYRRTEFEAAVAVLKLTA